ncbi:MAG: hypothetical protein V1701_08510 [Planctomycetota bacterium]
MKKLIGIILILIVVIGCSKEAVLIKETPSADVSPEALKIAAEKVKGKGENISVSRIFEDLLAGQEEILAVNACFLMRRESVPDGSFISYWMVVPNGRCFEIKSAEDLKPYLKDADTGEKAVKITKLVTSLVLSKRKLQLSNRPEDNKDNFNDLVNAHYAGKIVQDGGYQILVLKYDITIAEIINDNPIAEIIFDKDGKLVSVRTK